MDWDLVRSHSNISSQPLGHFNAAAPCLIWKLRTQDDNILSRSQENIQLIFVTKYQTEVT